MISSQLNSQRGHSADLGSFSNTLSCELQLPWSLQTHSSVSSIQGVCQLQSEFLFSEPQLGNSLQAVSWSNHRTHLICFLSRRNCVVLCFFFFQTFCLVYLVSGDYSILAEIRSITWLYKIPNSRCSKQSWSQDCIEEMANAKYINRSTIPLVVCGIHTEHTWRFCLCSCLISTTMIKILSCILHESFHCPLLYPEEAG